MMNHHHSNFIELARNFVATVTLLTVMYGGAVLVVEMLR
jgi:hypothetical protein